MIFISLVGSLLLTLLIEVPIAHFQKIPIKLAVLVNVLTNPIVVITYHLATYYSFPIVPILAVLEVSAVLVEGYLYKGSHKHPFIFSICANSISFGIGLLL